MIPKPEYLEGEANPFEDVSREDSDSLISLDRNDLVGYLCDLAETISFYLQPFEPDMVGKYFEGWEEKKTEFPVTKMFYKTKNYTIEFKHEKEFSGWAVFERDFIIITLNEENYENKVVVLCKTTSPQTLQHFISDCNRAGVKLTWKETK